MVVAALASQRVAGQTSTNPAVRTAAETSPPVLTTVEQVHRLTRVDAARGYRAVIRGVVTCALPESAAVALQDATRGIYVDQLTPALGGVPEVGEQLEVEGVTDPGEFAPQLHARKLTRLGKGELPEPVRATWDQLINGSLDTQFVEIKGVATSARADGFTLLTHGGRINAVLFRLSGPTNGAGLKQYENSLIRLRGCLFAAWDANTHQVQVGEIRMFSPTVLVDEPAPEDMFAVWPKRVPELLLFDPEASALRRVKVSGQIVQERGGEYYLMDGGNGMRFSLREPARLAVGDLVEVVGFPSLTGPSPVLRESVVRTIGTGAVPEAKPLSADDLFRPEHDATRVRVEAMLLSVSANQQTLELQAGLRRFVASLNPGGVPREPIRIGSQLELSGVYAGQGGSRTAGGDIASFELLLNAPADIRVLAQPPFWTFPRLLILVGALVTVLVAALIWIRLLHHKVQARTAQLQNEIREREHAEHQRAMAQERARIARDLHDDLGSSLTEITMLATTSPGGQLPAEDAAERLDTIAGKSRTMVHALDEIVWAVDPERDTLASVARYLASYAEEYLAGLNISCRVQMPNTFPDQVISGEARHHLFLAVKEAINNAVRHGGPTEIGFRVRMVEERMQITISDNGSGFDPADRLNGHGLGNLRDRLERMNGQCELVSAPGAGTSVTLQLPLPVRKNHS
jgi:signal transduction histidine kinase